MAGTITHRWDGTTLIVTSDSGTSGCDLKGATGDMGIRGSQGSPGEPWADDKFNQLIQDTITDTVPGAVEDAVADMAESIKNDVLAETADIVYPVGSIYLSVSETSPAFLFGGTWARLQNRFLLGAGTTYTAGNTGGAATHTLTETEMPNHTHKEMLSNGSWNYYAVYSEGGQTTSTYTGASISNLNVSAVGRYAFVSNTGGSAAHNNMPPYLAVYMWKRTA